MKNFCIDKIREFLYKYIETRNTLNDKIEYLCHEFCFEDLKTNKDGKYGKRSIYRVSDDMDSLRLARMIYYLVWGEYDGNDYAIISLKDVDNTFDAVIKGGKYGGETINTYSTLFGSNDEKANEIFVGSIPKEVKVFRTKYLTLGNFMVLPKGEKLVSKTLNQKKEHYGDYADKFYCKLFDPNDMDVYPLGKQCGLNPKDFCTKNFLEPFFDIPNSYIPKIVFDYSITDSKEFALDYIKKASNIIDYRADRICAILKERLK